MEGHTFQYYLTKKGRRQELAGADFFVAARRSDHRLIVVDAVTDDHVCDYPVLEIDTAPEQTDQFAWLMASTVSRREAAAFANGLKEGLRQGAERRNSELQKALGLDVMNDHLRSITTAIEGLQRL